MVPVYCGKEIMNELKLRVYPPASDGVAEGLAVVLSGSYDIPGLEFSAPARILDIGGHVGSFSVWAAHRWPGAQITTYEPHPVSAAFCRLNTDGFSTVVECAVVGSGRPETLLLHEGIRNTGQRSIHMLGEQRSEGLMVKTLRARDLPPADILKIDTEGCEIEILAEYQHMPGVQAIMVEWHGLPDYHALLKLLPSMGFRLVRDDTGGQYAGDRNLIFQRDKKASFTLMREEYDLASLPNLNAPSVLDVGANVGGFIRYACQRWANVKAIAFEPHPETFELLKSNTLSNLEVQCRQVAVVHPKTTETVRLYEGANNREECSIRNDVRWPHVSQKLDTWVDVPTIDATELPPCDVLKVDTEGAEVDILTGYRHLSTVKILLVEAHPVGGDLQGEIRRIIEIAEAAGLRQAASDRFGILRFVRETVAAVPGITITGTVKDAPSAAASSVRSVRAQTHASFRHVLFALGDETLSAATKEASDDLRIDVRVPATPSATRLANLLPVWRSLPDDEIIVWLDGDDELLPHALERVLDAHRKGAWVTYGQFSVNGHRGFAAPVGDNPRCEPWRATHLKTFRAGLVKQMRDADFRELDGSYAGHVPDARIMFGVLELAGRDRSVFIPDVLYVYNEANSFCANASTEEMNLMSLEFDRVRGFASYARTDSLAPSTTRNGRPSFFRLPRANGESVSAPVRADALAVKDMDLVQIFRKYGTDKLVNGYAPVYHTLLNNRREQIRSVLEVGIGTMIPNVHSSMVGYAGAGYSPGGSLRAWRDYFRNASVLGMDVQPDTQFSEERIQTVLCDSTDALAVQRAVGDKMFDFIVDDGSHVDVNQFSTLRNLYSRLRPGGFYVIEDIHPGNSVRDAPHLVGSIVGHNEYFFTGIRNNLCVIYAQPMTSYKREAW